MGSQKMQTLKWMNLHFKGEQVVYSQKNWKTDIDRNTHYYFRISTKGEDPSPYDRILVTRFGAVAVNLIENGDINKMVCVDHHAVKSISLSEISGKTKPFQLMVSTYL